MSVRNVDNNRLGANELVCCNYLITKSDLYAVKLNSEGIGNSKICCIGFNVKKHRCLGFKRRRFDKIFNLLSCRGKLYNTFIYLNTVKYNACIRNLELVLICIAKALISTDFNSTLLLCAKSAGGTNVITNMLAIIPRKVDVGAYGYSIKVEAFITGYNKLNYVSTLFELDASKINVNEGNPVKISLNCAGKNTLRAHYLAVYNNHNVSHKRHGNKSLARRGCKICVSRLICNYNKLNRCTGVRIHSGNIFFCRARLLSCAKRTKSTAVEKNVRILTLKFQRICKACSTLFGASRFGRIKVYTQAAGSTSMITGLNASALGSTCCVCAVLVITSTTNFADAFTRM